MSRKLPKHHIQWFEQLKHAAKHDRLALMDCASPDGDRSVICLVNVVDGQYEFVPVGELCEAANPFEHYTPPT